MAADDVFKLSKSGLKQIQEEVFGLQSKIDSSIYTVEKRRGDTQAKLLSLKTDLKDVKLTNEIFNNEIKELYIEIEQMKSMYKTNKAREARV